MIDPFEDEPELDLLDDDPEEIAAKKEAAFERGWKIVVWTFWSVVVMLPLSALITGNIAAFAGLMIFYTIFGMIAMMFALLAFG